MQSPRHRSNSRSFRALSDLLEQGGSLRNQEAATVTLDGLMQHAKILQRLQNVLTSSLPPSLNRACRVANLSGDTISVLCNHPSMGARIRQMGPSLINAWRSAGFVCSALDVRIRPNILEESKAQPFNRDPISTVTAEALAHLEEEITDPALKQALARLRQSARDSN